MVQAMSLYDCADIHKLSLESFETCSVKDPIIKILKHVSLLPNKMSFNIPESNCSLCHFEI